MSATEAEAVNNNSNNNNNNNGGRNMPQKSGLEQKTTFENKLQRTTQRSELKWQCLLQFKNDMPTKCAKDCGPHNRACEYGRVHVRGSQFLAHAVEH